MTRLVHTLGPVLITMSLSQAMAKDDLVLHPANEDTNLVAIVLAAEASNNDGPITSFGPPTAPMPHTRPHLRLVPKN